MKYYLGIDQNRIDVADGETVYQLRCERPHWTDNGNAFSWGKEGKSVLRNNLALAILADALGDEARAEKLMARFQWRMIATLKHGQPWKLSHGQVLEAVADIEGVERNFANHVRQMERERPQVQIDGISRDQEWSSNPELTPNWPKRG
jgi:hypothetical protein